jgi:hypothetical protein
MPDTQTAETALPHPEEMNARVELRIGNAVSVQATARATPAGLVAAGLLVASILLSAAYLVRASRGRVGSVGMPERP